jgi:hypothetical protein
MKAKPYFHNSFLQLLAHRERGRIRLIAWSIGKPTGQNKARWKALLQSPTAELKPHEAAQLPRPGLLG